MNLNVNQTKFGPECVDWFQHQEQEQPEEGKATDLSALKEEAVQILQDSAGTIIGSGSTAGEEPLLPPVWNVGPSQRVSVGYSKATLECCANISKRQAMDAPWCMHVVRDPARHWLDCH